MSEYTAGLLRRTMAMSLSKVTRSYCGCSTSWLTGHNPIGVLSNSCTDSRIEWICAVKSPRCNSDDDVSVVGEGSARVSLTGVLAAHIQDAGAHHAFVDVRPILIIRLSLQVSIASCTLFLVDDVHVDMQ
ncbi:hypothetical protein SFRURICE_005847 [Spodoptera frugiperda]|nr:hypothetical protein SFRURICE_005847 [Spodoptera frugiperda]